MSLSQETSNRMKTGAYAVLIGLCLMVYGQALRFDFVGYDDGIYVTDCRPVQAGLTRASLLWAFTTDRAKYFQPLAWLSHELDCQVYGLKPWGHHLTNLLFHILNSLLLFHVLVRMTRGLTASQPHSLTASFLAAALFAVHPLHVESVAWVSERKDVLSTFFWLLAMGAYLRYVEMPNVARYVAVVAFYAFALMAKPMVVTFPFALLLLDYWPLKRLEAGGWRLGAWGWLILEKTPLLMLSLVISVVTYVMQRHGGNLVFGENVPWAVRLSNAPVGYVFYLAKTFVPYNLTVYYPHPFTVRPLWQAGGALLLLGVVTVVALCTSRKRPYLLIGWLWYLGTLVPVIQIIQAADFAYADRYTYIPLIGVFLMLSWGIADLARGSYARRRIVVGAAVLWLAGLTVAGMLQARYWRDTASLFTHALEVGPESALAHNNLGLAVAESGKTQEAIDHYRRAIQLDPRCSAAYNNLGLALALQGRTPEAVAEYEKALRVYPEYTVAHSNLGLALAELGRTQDAVEHYRKAIQLEPDYAAGYSNLALALAELGRPDEAMQNYREALRIDPDSVETHNNMALTYYKQGNYPLAMEHCKRALQSEPRDPSVLTNVGMILTAQGRYDEAIRYYQEAIRISPSYMTAHINLGNTWERMSSLASANREIGVPGLEAEAALDNALKAYQAALAIDANNAEAHCGIGKALSKRGRTQEAMDAYTEAIRLKPRFALAHNNLGVLLARQGRFDEAVQHFSEALRIDPNDTETHENLERALARTTTPQVEAAPTSPPQ